MAFAAATLALALSIVPVSAGSCGGYPETQCQDSHLCCAADSGDGAGWCCPRKSWRNQTFQCAFGIDGLGVGVQYVRNCCEGRPVCGVGVGSHYCCMGPVSKQSSNGCAMYGPPLCCNSMCGDELCDSECQGLGGMCTPGAAADGGQCVSTVAGLPIKPPLV